MLVSLDEKALVSFRKLGLDARLQSESASPAAHDHDHAVGAISGGEPFDDQVHQHLSLARARPPHHPGGAAQIGKAGG